MAISCICRLFIYVSRCYMRPEMLTAVLMKIPVFLDCNIKWIHSVTDVVEEHFVWIRWREHVPPKH